MNTTLNQYCALHNLDQVTIDFCIFAISKGDSHVEYLFNCLQKEELSKYLKMVVANNHGEGWELRPKIVKLLEQEKRKDKGDSFTKLIQKLGIDNEVLQFEKKFGYFFSPKSDRESAKNIYEIGDYEMEKTIAVIKKYYREWDSEMGVKGVYSLLCSPLWYGIYNNYKEETIKYKGLR